jgi:hypothetical protein
MGYIAAAALVLLSGTPAPVVVDPAPVRLTVIWTDMVHCAADRRAVEAEVAAALEPLRVTVGWKTRRPAQATSPDSVRVVVLLSRKSALDPATMGSSNPGSPSPTIWVQYDNVLRALAMGDGERADPATLGVAVGRVIAHELVHLLAPGRKHDRTGLFAPQLGARALLSRGTRLSPSFVRWYRTREAGTRTALARPAPAETTSVASGIGDGAGR